MATKEVMNEEVMENETVEEVVEVIKEDSKIKVIWNKVKKPLSYVVVGAIGFGIALATTKIGESAVEELEEETATEE